MNVSALVALIFRWKCRNKYIATAKPVKNGRVELIHYIKEQSISFEFHRYGSILDVPPVE